MDEPLPATESPPEAPKPRTTSLLARLMNVFAVPGQVFEEVKASPMRFANWIVPTLLWVIVSAVATTVLLSQPDIQQKLHDAESKLLDKQTQAGNTTTAEAAKALSALDTVTAPLVVALVVAFGLVRVFWWAFVLWMFGLTFLRSRFDYAKGLEVAGLAIMISVLGGIVTLVITVDVGHMFSGHGPAFTITDAALNRRSSLLNGAASLFSIWQLGVMSVGLSRIAGVSFLRAAWLVFAYWVLQQTFLIVLGVGQMGA